MQHKSIRVMTAPSIPSGKRKLVPFPNTSTPTGSTFLKSNLHKSVTVIHTNELPERPLTSEGSIRINSTASFCNFTFSSARLQRIIETNSKSLDASFGKVLRIEQVSKFIEKVKEISENSLREALLIEKLERMEKRSKLLELAINEALSGLERLSLPPLSISAAAQCQITNLSAIIKDVVASENVQKYFNFKTEKLQKELDTAYGENAELRNEISSLKAKLANTPKSPPPELVPEPKPFGNRFCQTVKKVMKRTYEKTTETQLIECFTKALVLLDKSIEHNQANVQSTIKDEYCAIMSSQATLVFQNNPRDQEIRSEHREKLIIFKSCMPFYIQLLGISKPLFMNNLTPDDLMKKELETILGYPVHNYLIVPRKNLRKEVEEILIIINKLTTDNEIEHFTAKDKMFGLVISALNGIVHKYVALYQDYRHEIDLTAAVYQRFESLISCFTIGTLSETIEQHCKELVNCERTNVIFYDPDRKALYKRVKSKHGELVKWFKEEDKGIGSLCVSATTSFMCSNVQKDRRFNPLLDDHLLDKHANKPKGIIAVPIIDNKDVDGMPTAIGVIIVINKKMDERFTTRDMENLQLYAGVVGKVIKNATMLEYFLSVQGPVKKMGNQTVTLLRTMDTTSEYISQLESGMCGLKAIIAKKNT